MSGGFLDRRSIVRGRRRIDICPWDIAFIMILMVQLLHFDWLMTDDFSLTYSSMYCTRLVT